MILAQNEILSMPLGIVFSVIDRRYRSGRPLIVTTNLPIKQLKEETNIEKKRIYDRILEMCVPLYVGGSSYRSDIAHEKNGKNENLFATAESSQTEKYYRADRHTKQSDVYILV